MVKLHSISLTNFMNIEQLDMEFEDHTTIMIGGGNGEGKSALVAALALALVGYRKGDSYRDYVRRGYEEARIELYADMYGYPIHYDIHLRNKQYVQPMERTIHYRDKTYNNSECKILLDELDVDYLEHVMFLYQNSNSIADLRPAERAKLLKKLFHFEFDDHVAILKKRLEDEQTRLHDTSVRYEEASKREFSLIRLLPEISEKDTGEWKRLLSKQRKELSSLEHYDEEYVQNFERELQEARSNFRARDSWYRKNESQIRQKEKEADRVREELNTLAIVPVEGDLDDLRSKLAALKKQEKEYDQQLAILMHRKTALEQQLSIAATGVCYACGHEVDEEHVQSLQQSLRDLKEEKELVSAKASALDNRAVSLQEVIWSLEAYHKKIEYKQTLENQLTSILQQVVELQNSFRESGNAREFAKNTLDEMEVRAQQIQKIKERIQQKKAIETSISTLEQKLEEAVKSTSINQERRKMNEDLLLRKNEHAELLSSLSEQYNTYATQVDVLRQSIAIFETDFPNYIILKTCAQLENYINGFIQKVFPYMRVKLKPSRSGVEFFYVSQSSEDDWLSVKMASGAQSAILSLAWRVAVAKLYGISTIILDEADASATEETAQIIYQFIAELDAFDQLIFISHKQQAMKEVSSRIDNVMCYYVQDGEYSVIENV